MTTATATKTKRQKSGGSGTTLSAGELLEAVTAVMRAVPGHGPKPILSNLRIGDGLVSGTDLEVRIDHEVPITGPAFLVPGQRLQAILRSVPRDAELTITPDGARVRISAAGGRWELPTEDVAEYPVWEPVDAKPVARLPADQFARAVRATAYACDQQSSRFALGCVLVEVVKGDPTWVATDGRRLSAVETETDQAVDDSSTLLPARAVRLMATLAAGSESGVQLEATKSEVICTVDRATITARLTDGKFPRWRDVFPKRDVEPSVVAVADLAAAVRAASVCTSEASKGVDFVFGDVLTLRSRSAEAGEAEVTCELLSAGKATTVRMDPSYVLEFLGGLDVDDEPQVEIEASGPGDAVLLRCGDVKGIVMPMAAD